MSDIYTCQREGEQKNLTIIVFVKANKQDVNELEILEMLLQILLLIS